MEARGARGFRFLGTALRGVLPDAEWYVDFTIPTRLLSNALALRAGRRPVVLGTTGFDPRRCRRRARMQGTRRQRA